MVTGKGKGLAGRQAKNTGGGSDEGWTPGRRTTNRSQGGDDGGRSQGKDRRDLEQEELGGTQIPETIATHKGAEQERNGGRRADESRRSRWRRSLRQRR